MKTNKTILLLLLVVLYSGCSLKEPTTLSLTILSQKEINQDKDKISSPLMLVFYELESAEAFSKLSYWNILDESGQRLSADLISQTKHMITANKEHEYNILFSDKAKFLGIIGKFYNINEPTWRYVINLEKNENNEETIKIIDYKIMKD